MPANTIVAALGVSVTMMYRNVFAMREVETEEEEEEEEEREETWGVFNLYSRRFAVGAPAPQRRHYRAELRLA